MITSVRVATKPDAAALAALVDAQELGADPNATPTTEANAIDLMTGYVDPSDGYLLSIDGEEGFSAAVMLHPDSVKRKFFTDVYVHPSIEDYGQVIDWALEKAAAEHPDWGMWPGLNSLDARLQAAWEAAGFEFKRKYNIMRVHFTEKQTERHVEGLTIEAIDPRNDAQLREMHAVHQDSFSGHFDFTPRPFEAWRTLMAVEEESSDLNGYFLARLDGVPAGLCVCSNEIVDLNRGFVWVLGVAHSAHGRGIGEALLRNAMVYFESRGLVGADLTVDTGNESGALRLYEKVGFNAESSWIQMAKDNWSHL